MRSADRETLRRLIERHWQSDVVLGVAVGIWHDGADHFEAFGVTDVSRQRPVDEDTAFQIGSISKTFTATAIMQLVDEGRLRVTDRVAHHLRGFKAPTGQATRDVRIHHLLTHTAGWFGDFVPDTGNKPDALRKVISRFGSEARQLTRVGSVWAYNNLGFCVAGRIIEVLRRAPYESVIERRILQPLGMTRTVLVPEREGKHAVGHVLQHGHFVPGRPRRFHRALNPAGGVSSTSRDLLRYARLHLTPRASEVLSRRSIIQMQATFMKDCLPDAMGLSWFLYRGRGISGKPDALVVSHLGSLANGFHAACVLVPSRELALVVLTNGETGDEVASRVVNWGLRRFAGVRLVSPTPRTLPKRRMAEYVGRYEMLGTVLSLEVSRQRLRLTGGVPGFGPGQRGWTLDTVGRDRFIVTSGAAKGSRVDAIRSSNDVNWLRVDGRLFERSH